MQFKLKKNKLSEESSSMEQLFKTTTQPSVEVNHNISHQGLIDENDDYDEDDELESTFGHYSESVETSILHCIKRVDSEIALCNKKLNDNPEYKLNNDTFHFLLRMFIDFTSECFDKLMSYLYVVFVTLLTAPFTLVLIIGELLSRKALRLHYKNKLQKLQQQKEKYEEQLQK
ncbi:MULTISPECIES: hypothetical protein [Burkholderia]|uniref:hypothetical protein n=1 Tax=Burkholderia TaxID=32008 RepID=UPI001180EF5B|nr:MULTISPECIES: hypothetical protein [Burkholderia]